MKSKKNRQYNRTLKKADKAPKKPLTKEQADGVIQSMRIALEAVMGAIQVSIALRTPIPRYEVGNIVNGVKEMVKEQGDEFIVDTYNKMVAITKQKSPPLSE